ncbi:MAG: DUF2141 domain-containing protein [Bacteroidales bacterium]|nr:DUF2141 domain-containing protein [Bacteroidales bacterium]
MESLTKYRLKYLCFLVFLFSFNLYSQNVEVIITNIRSTKGQIIIKAYKDNKSFQDNQPYSTYKVNKNQMQKGTITITINLTPGIYGLALLDDENNNNTMDYNFFGIPTEGFGFSNYYLNKMAKPNFDEFKFTVTPNQVTQVKIKIKYM